MISFLQEERRRNVLLLYRLVDQVHALTGQHENSAHRQHHEAHQGNNALEQHLKLHGIEFAAQVVHEGVNLAQAEHAEGCHVLR